MNNAERYRQDGALNSSEACMDQPMKTVLAEYEQRSAEEIKLMRSLSREQFMARIDEFLICVGPEVGQLLNLLIAGAGAKTIVELGASYGYSTMWLADAARATGGKVHSLELSPKKVEFAREQLRRAGLESFVEFHVGDALETLKKLPGPLDFVLVDLWKDLYSPCFELFHPKLASGALVAADNMLYPPTARPDATAYQNLVRQKGDMDSLLLNIGNGIELSRKK
jgi:predicted O-methyltransferase YrrM